MRVAVKDVYGLCAPRSKLAENRCFANGRTFSSNHSRDRRADCEPCRFPRDLPSLGATRPPLPQGEDCLPRRSTAKAEGEGPLLKHCSCAQAIEVFGCKLEAACASFSDSRADCCSG